MGNQCTNTQTQEKKKKKKKKKKPMSDDDILMSNGKTPGFPNTNLTTQKKKMKMKMKIRLHDHQWCPFTERRACGIPAGAAGPDGACRCVDRWPGRSRRPTADARGGRLEKEKKKQLTHVVGMGVEREEENGHCK
jgi:hypothetical protein